MALTIRNKFWYGLGDFGFSLSATFLASNFLYFLTGPAGLSMAVASLVVFLGKTSDYLNDPVVGYISDRVRSPWGRRRPFLLWGALPFGITFFLLWLVPGQSPWLGALYYVVAYMVFDLAASFVYIPYYALTPELSAHYDERTSLTAYRMVFSILGSLAAFAIPVDFVDGVGPIKNTRQDFMWIAAAIALVCVLSIVAVFFFTREQEINQSAERPGLRDALKAALHNRVFVLGGLVFLLSWTAVEILTAIIKYYIAFVLGREDSSMVFLLALFLTALASLPLWNWLARRWNKRRAYILGAGILAVALLAMLLLDQDSSDLVVLLLCLLGGLGAGAIHLIPWSMLPDAVEVDEVSTGQRHEGTYYSLISLAQKISTSLAVPFAGLVMGVSGFAEGQAVQTAQARWGIKLAMGLGPAVLLAAGIVCAMRYPLSRAEHAGMVAALGERRGRIPSDNGSQE